MTNEQRLLRLAEQEDGGSIQVGGSMSSITCYMVAAGTVFSCGIRFFGPFQTRELAQQWIDEVWNHYNNDVTEIVPVHIPYNG
jgi:hypothetical protein